MEISAEAQKTKLVCFFFWPMGSFLCGAPARTIVKQNMVNGKHVVERKACGVRSANIRTAPDIVKRNARGLDLQKYAPHRI